MRETGKRQSKLKEILSVVRAAVSAGRYCYTLHGEDRLDQRITSLGLVEPEVSYVLRNGFREDVTVINIELKGQ